MRRWIAALLLFFAPLVVRAEYRVALLIGEDGASARTLESLGFRCEKTPALDDKELKRKIEDWTDRTPANSTAVIAFGGDLRAETVDGKPRISLVAGNDRMVPAAAVFEMMTQRGGSRLNALLVKELPPEGMELFPENCVLSTDGVASFAKAHGITGKGSVAVSSPDKFVPGQKAGDEWVNARGMVFCWCPPGSYTAGSPVDTPGRFADEAQRKVTVSRGFWIGKYEHTLGQRLKGGRLKEGENKNHPVVNLHWDDGSRMVKKRLTEEERKANRLPGNWEYSLPTADQWEYAARAGTTTLFYFGNDLRHLPQHANFGDKSYYDSGDIYSNAAHRVLDDGFARLAPVGSFSANSWGLHDVYGNVTEWCIDKEARGGSWMSVAENCRSAYRDSHSSRDDQIYLGYRFVIQPKSEE